MLALEDDLISEYIAFQKGRSYNKNTIIKLFKYLHLPFKMSVKQKNDIGLDDEIAKSLSDSGTVIIRNFVDEDTLIEATKLKLMLAKDRTCGTYPYPYINILEDETDVSFTSTYKNGEDRNKAVEHIKALLKDSSNIKIYDKYLSKINRTNDSWLINKQVLLAILPRKVIEIDIYCDANWNRSRETDLTRICTDWTINKEEWIHTVHDRYIETDKVIILLSSGIINLSDVSEKDFTYVVKIK